MFRKWYNAVLLYLAKRIKFSEIIKLQADLKNKKLLIIGEHTYGAEKIRFHSYRGSEAVVTIGKYCSIAPDVNIITGGIHPPNWVSLYSFRIKWGLSGAYEDGMPTTKGPIVIGNDVWISTGVTILSGVEIGNGAIIAAGAVVIKDVPPFSIVGGNPAKVIKYRFNSEDIGQLQKINWWNWPDEKVKNEIEFLSSPNIKDFIDKHKDVI